MEKLYTNCVAIEAGIYDFCFNFSVRDRGQTEDDVADSVTRVYMSPQHAKALFNILGANLMAYEQQIGELKIPRELVQPVPAEESEK